MNADSLLAVFGKLNVWSARGERAPHKPLLVLWAIGRCLRGEPRMTSYREVDKHLGALLRDFGPYRKVVHTDFPFWRLRGDGVWALDGADQVTVNRSGDANKRELREHDVRGGFPKEIHDALAGNSALAEQIARSLLDAHFPSTRHDEILRAVGIDPDFVQILRAVGDDSDFVQSRRRRREAGFRERVLQAYAYRCAVCSFAVRLDDKPIALDAAHIKWHQARGPAVVRNGLALCTLHHKLFDAGAFTLFPHESPRRSRSTYSRSRRPASTIERVAEDRPMLTSDFSPPIVVVATSVSGTGLDESLGRFDRRPVYMPADGNSWPDPKHLNWHTREVFKSPGIIPRTPDDGVRTLHWR